jgi:superfamily II DNA or RNA helicase
MPKKKKRKTVRELTILRSGNRIVLDPTTPRIKTLIAPELTFTEKVFLRGREAMLARKAKRPTVYEQDWECFGEDHRGRISTNFGFVPRIEKVLNDAGIDTRIKDLSPHPNPEVYKPRWDRLKGETFRYKQEKILKLIATEDNGRVDCPPGYGKSYLIAQAARLFPKAKIAVCTKRVTVMNQRIYPELCQMLPDVGIVGGGRKSKHHRVMCYTLGSLHHADGDEDFVFVDEGHEACADDAATKMAKFDHARIWMFSASWGKRLDNKDKRAEGMAGPVRVKVSYQKAVKHGMVVPITILWRDVIMDVDPGAGYRDTEKQRQCYWANRYRNKQIRRDAHLYDDDTQVLISVATFEHALYLKQLLPEFELVYNPDSQTDKDWRYYKKEGLLPEDFRIITDKRRAKFTKRFETGKLKKVIATPVWNVGVDFGHLQVLIRADGGGSPINDTQIPGRTSRLGDGSKLCGIVHDYRDQFNTGCSRKANDRGKSYDENGWEQRQPKKTHRELTVRKLMGLDTV